MTILANPPTDLDNIFEPRVTTAIANTGFQYGGVDLAQRYEALSSGSAASATGLLVNGSDLNAKFCAKGSAAPQFYNPAECGGASSFQIAAIAWSGTRFAAVGRDATNKARFTYSTDGTTWQASAYIGGSAVDFNPVAIAWNGSRFVCVGNMTSGGSTYLHYSYSADGTSWTAPANNFRVLTAGRLSLCWDGSKFVCVGQGTSSYCQYTTSTDGTNWIAPANMGTATVGAPRLLIHNGSTFVAMIGTGKVSSSSNGTTWSTPALISSTFDSYSILWNGSQFMAFGENTSTLYPLVSTSSNGTTWSTPASMHTGRFRPMCTEWHSGKSKFVSIGLDIYDGYAKKMISADGSTWQAPVNLGTSQTSATMFDSLIMPSGKILAVGYGLSGTNGAYCIQSN